MSYMWQENAAAAAGMAALIVAWRTSFGFSLRVPLHSSIPEDIYSTLGGRRLVTYICRAKNPGLMGEGPPCADILMRVHDRSLTMGVAGAARLAIAPPPPPYPPVAIMGPPPLAVPTSVVSLNLWAPPPPAQGIAPLAGVPSVYQRPNVRPRKATPAPAPPPAVSPRGSVARVLKDGDFPKLVPSNLPAKAKQVNQGDGIHTVGPYEPRPVVKAPPQGPYPVERRDIVATHQASPPPQTPAVDDFAGLERVEPKVKDLSLVEQARMCKRKKATGPAPGPKVPKA